MNWEKIWNSIVNWFSTSGLKVLSGVLALIIGVIIVKIIIKILRTTLNKTKLEKVVIHFLINVSKFVLYLMVLYIFASIIGIPMTGFIAVLSAAGLAVSLALQGSLSNLANGVVLIITKPFNENDFVEIDGQSGSVKEIKMMYTILTTSDNKVITIPNKTVVENTLINYSANDTRKVIFNFEVAYTSDVEKVKAIIHRVFMSNEYVFLEPEPFVALKSLGSSNILFTANCWCKSNHYWDVYYDVLDKVFNEFKREEISIAYDQVEVRVHDKPEVLPYKNEIVENVTELKEQKYEDYKKRKAEKDEEITLFPGIVIKKKRKRKSTSNKSSSTKKETDTKKKTEPKKTEPKKVQENKVEVIEEKQDVEDENK